MKKGYIRLLIFVGILILILLMNTFLINILSSYKMVFFLLVVLVIFDFYFMLEKDSNRFFKDLLFEIFLFLMTFFIIFYILGFVVGLVKMPSYLTFVGIKNVLLPIILLCILKEVLRFNLLRKSDGNTICTIAVVVLLLLVDVSSDYGYANFSNKYGILSFFALVLLPAISKNLSYSYISKKYGYKPIIVFDLIYSLSFFLLPLRPNPNEYLMSIIYIIVPALFAYKIYNFYSKRSKTTLKSDYNKKRFKGILLPLVLITLMVYFYSGYFRYYAIAIASGSMETKIHKGDIVIVDQKVPYKSLQIGDVLAYKNDKIIVVHRIVKKIEVGDSYVYYTKGDANNHVDDLVIEEDAVIGKVDFKIPYIGLPTVWFSEK